MTEGRAQATVNIEPVVSTPAEDLSIEVKATAYCPCEKCCGKSDGITKSGKSAFENYTIAVDPTIIPLGSWIFIENLGWRYAHDTGGAIRNNKIDVFYTSHKAALSFGVKKMRILKIVRPSREKI